MWFATVDRVDEESVNVRSGERAFGAVLDARFRSHSDAYANPDTGASYRNFQLIYEEQGAGA